MEPLCNLWLPPPIAEQLDEEESSFHTLALRLRETWQPGDAQSALETLKLVEVVQAFLDVRSKIALEDVKAIVDLGLEIVLDDCVGTYVRYFWTKCLSGLARKYRKKLDLTIQWRPLYNIFWRTHFNRQQFYEGSGVTRGHLRSFSTFIKYYRRFFPPGSASEIWNEFRPAFDDLNRIRCLEALGFVSLFLPTCSTFLTSEWIQECLDLWGAVPSCQFWNREWSGLITRCLKCQCQKISWEPFMSTLFSRYLNSFQVPVARSTSYPPVDWEVSERIFDVFDHKCSSRLAARSVICLLSQGGPAQAHFEKLVDLLEPYYHPSNGGSWTESLQLFLFYLVYYFFKRLVDERKLEDATQGLGVSDRTAFIKTALRLAERGQHSKNFSLAYRCSQVVAYLSYLEPVLALPIATASFKTAINSVTATHQLQSALRTLALSCRPIFMLLQTPGGVDVARTASDTLKDAMFLTLPGLDANDPPKTLVTMQFYCSVLSNVDVIGEENCAFSMDWPRWVAAFLDRIFILLHGLDPGVCGDEFSSDTLLGSGSCYFSLLRLFFGKLTRQLLEQAVVRVKKFVVGNVLPGAVVEVGSLCYAAIEGDPSRGANTIVEPIIENLVSTLTDSPSTGFADEVLCKSKHQGTALSPALERTASYYLNVAAKSLSGEGAMQLNCKELLKNAITLSFNAPSPKVNEAAQTLLKQVITGLISYYSINSFKSGQWISTKRTDDDFRFDPPKWHLPSPDEIMLVNELTECHVQGPISILSRVSVEGSAHFPVHEKDFLRVTLLRLEGALQGLGSCISEFPNQESSSHIPATVLGAMGARVGDSNLRQQIAEALHKACGYLLREKGDDSMVLKLLVSVMDATVNCSVEGNKWMERWDCWYAEVSNFTEPDINFITDSRPSKKRPPWLVYERVEIQNLYRISAVGACAAFPHPAVELIATDLLQLSLHRYEEVRSYASLVLLSLLERYPVLIPKLLPAITINLTDQCSSEEPALGACALLENKTVMRYLMEDWACFSAFLSSILSSAHHDSLKAQNAINKLFISFHWYFGGVQSKGLENTSYHNTIAQIKTVVEDESVHWRYNLMAQGLLLFLGMSPCPLSLQESRELSRNLCGHFLKNLTSELPALRPLSVIAVLLLIGAEAERKQKCETTHVNGVTNGMMMLLDTDFGHTMMKNSAIDHVYSEDGLDSSQDVSDSGLTSLMPIMDDWPVTRTWDSKTEGVAFSWNFAKLIDELTRRYGETVLDMLKQPLIDAANDTEDRGKQCTAAEVMAGLLHSDSPSVVLAWEEWLCDLLQRSLKATTLDSEPEWTACVRFAVSAEGKLGQVPTLCYRLLHCLTELVSTGGSSSLIAKSLHFLSAVLVELILLPADVTFHATLLQRTMTYRSHVAPQVRKAAGGALCILLASEVGRASADKFTRQLIDGALIAARSIQTHELRAELGTGIGLTDKISGQKSEKRKQAINEMETVVHFLLTCMKSGRFCVLSHVTVDLLHPLLLIQNTSEKDLVSLATKALRILKWQQFPPSDITHAVSVILRAANEENWRVRISVLKFVQPFIYRHSFVMDRGDWQLLWNKVAELLCDPQLEVRELASTALAGLMKGADCNILREFREQALASALSICPCKFQGFEGNGLSVLDIHGAVLRLASCILSVPYDIPSWLPEMVTTLAYFDHFQWPIKATVAGTIREFRRTHSDAWDIHKDQFSEDQLEVLLNCGTASYFA